MKTLSKILMVVLILVFVVVAVLGFLEMPVAAEGEDLTMAQEFLVTLKTHLSTILTAIGLPLDAVLLGLFVAISRQASATTAKAGVTSEEVETIKENQQAQQDELTAVDGNLTMLSDKMDILTEMFSETLLLSDMPASVRERIQTFKGKYDEAKAQIMDNAKDKLVKAAQGATGDEKRDCEEVVEKIKNAVETATTVYNGLKDTVSRF